MTKRTTTGPGGAAAGTGVWIEGGTVSVSGYELVVAHTPRPLRGSVIRPRGATA